MTTLFSQLVVGVLCAAVVAAQPCYFHTSLIDSTASTFDSSGFSVFNPPTATLTGDGWAIGPHDNTVSSAAATWSGLQDYDCYSVTFRYWAIDSQDAGAGDHGSVDVNGVEIWTGARAQFDSCANDPVFSPYSGQFPNPWSGDRATDKCFHDVVGHEATLPSLSTTFTLDLQGVVNQEVSDESWAVTRVIAAVGTTEPPCPLSFESAWLQTEFEPVLDVADSGFLKYSHGSDVISIVFDNPDKYDFISASIFSASESTVDHGDPADDVSASSPQSGAYTHPGVCYTRYEVHSVWGDVEPGCSRDEVSDADFIIYTCKLRVENRETLDPIRGTALNRQVISEIPYQIKFPKQVSASVLGLSAFQPPNVLAAIVRQEVIVNVNDLAGGLDATIKLYTSTQWPFRLNDGSHAVTATPTDISPAAFVLETDCADANLGDVANPAVDDSAACGQIWRLELDVANGAAGPPCELDGDYAVRYSAECQPSFEALTDCPLVQDDQGQIQNEFPVEFRIDSEWFCPQVVHTVDLSASLHVWKDQAHSIAATNFIIGQTAYFEARTASTEVTIVKTVANRVTIKPLGESADTLVYSLQEPGAADCQAADLGNTGAVNGLAVQDGPCEGAPADEAWFKFLVDDTSVPGIPTDGSRDFEVGVVLDVTFKNAGALLEQTVTLLQTVSSTDSEQRARAQFGVGGNDDTTAGAAGLALGAAAAGVAAAGLLL